MVTEVYNLCSVELNVDMFESHDPVITGPTQLRRKSQTECDVPYYDPPTLLLSLHSLLPPSQISSILGLLWPLET